MSLYDNYNQREYLINKEMNVIKKWNDDDFPGNELGTCAAQVLMWCMQLEGQITKKIGIRESLLNPYEKATNLQFGPLKNGRELTKIASETVDTRGKNSAVLIEKMTPWTGKYKLYGISNNKSDGHIIGAYFPWFGETEFYDPNLVYGKIKSDGSIYRILSEWINIYKGCGGQDAYWGHETLFVIGDPKEAIGKING